MHCMLFETSALTQQWEVKICQGSPIKGALEKAALVRIFAHSAVHGSTRKSGHKQLYHPVHWRALEPETITTPGGPDM